MKNLNNLLKISLSARTIFGHSFYYLFITLLWIETTLAFFQSLGTFPLSMKDLKISSPQSFNMRILIISWLRALVKLRFITNFPAACFLKGIVKRNFFVFLEESVGNILELSTKGALLGKKLIEKDH